MEVDISVLGCSPLLENRVPDHDILSADRDACSASGSRSELLELVETSELQLRLPFIRRELDVLGSSY